MQQFLAYYFIPNISESNSSTNVYGNFTSPSPNRNREKPLQPENDNASHKLPDHVPGRSGSQHPFPEEEQREHHREHPRRVQSAPDADGMPTDSYNI